jgi:arylsulfatase A-like enzyme
MDWIRGGNDPASGEKEIEYLAGQLAYTDILSEQGYICGITGKWHLGASTQPQKGFSFWRVTPRGGGPYYHSEMVKNGKTFVVPEYLTDAITDAGLEFLNQQQTNNKPFYLSVHYTAPHSPWVDQHPEDIVASYENCEFESCPQEPLHPGMGFYELRFTRQLSKRGDQPIPVREHLKGYFAAVTAMDANIGRILDWLEQNDLVESTLVIFLSDNGFNCGHHGIWGKGNATFPLNLYDTSVKVPAIISQPGRIPRDMVNDALLSGYDFMPTLLEYLQIEHEESSDIPGRSFAGYLRGEEVDQNGFVVVYDEYGPARMIRTREWKYIHRYPYGPHELYDLINDPGERVNLLLDERQFTLSKIDRDRLVESFRYQLERWFDRYVTLELDGTRQPVTGRGQIERVGEQGKGKIAFHPREKSR